MALQLLDLTEAEIRELGHAIEARVDELNKLRKKTDDAGLSTNDVDYHLSVLVGDDVEKGLRYRVSSQVGQLDAMHEASDSLRIPFRVQN